MTKTPTETISDADEIVLETVALAKDQVDTELVAVTRKGKKKTRKRSQRKLSRDDEGLYSNFCSPSFLSMNSF